MRFLLSFLVPVCLVACATLPQSDRELPMTMSSAAVRRAVAAAVETQDRRGVTIGLQQLAATGATLSPETLAQLAPLIDPAEARLGTAPFGSLAERLGSVFGFNGRTHADSEPFADVPAAHRLIEGIAWDEARERLFVGTVLDRAVLVRDGEVWRTVQMRSTIGGAFGMAVDAPRRLLWFASAGVEPMPEPDRAFSGLVAVDLDRLEEVRRVEVAGARLGDVAVAGDGTLYASDGRSGAIYRCRPGCAAPEILVAPGILHSPQGMAIARNGRHLYVADYEAGLFRVELDSGEVEPIRLRRPEMLDGIDGLLLYPFDGALIAIQNGTRPRRIVKIALDHSGRIVDRVTVLEQNVDGWGEPTLGTLVGSGLVYVADGQWERWGAGGVLTHGAEPRATALRRIPHLGAVIVRIDPSPVRIVAERRS